MVKAQVCLPPVYLALGFADRVNHVSIQRVSVQQARLYYCGHWQVRRLVLGTFELVTRNYNEPATADRL